MPCLPPFNRSYHIQIMSTHTFQTKYQGNLIQIVSGWNQKFQGFFLVIELNAVADDDQYLYSNLDDDELEGVDGFPPNLEYFLEILADFELIIPERMRLELLKDKASNIGNRKVTYASDGTMKG